jgi:hypothetical protein
MPKPISAPQKMQTRQSSEIASELMSLISDLVYALSPQDGCSAAEPIVFIGGVHTSCLLKEKK